MIYMKIYSKLKNWYDGLHYEDSDTSLDLDSEIKKRTGRLGQSASRSLLISPAIILDYITTESHSSHYIVYAACLSFALISPFIQKRERISDAFASYETKFTKKLKNTRLFKNIL